MATVAITSTEIKSYLSRKVMSIVWTPLTSANATGDAHSEPGTADRSAQVAGTFNGATCLIQGSNDGSNWVTLTDILGNALSFTATGLKQITEITRYIRPSTSGGGGSQSLTVYLIERGSQNS